jgi:hypothetical protein
MLILEPVYIFSSRLIYFRGFSISKIILFCWQNYFINNSIENKFILIIEIKNIFDNFNCKSVEIKSLEFIKIKIIFKTIIKYEK